MLKNYINLLLKGNRYVITYTYCTGSECFFSTNRSY